MNHIIRYLVAFLFVISVDSCLETLVMTNLHSESVYLRASSKLLKVEFLCNTFDKRVAFARISDVRIDNSLRNTFNSLSLSNLSTID